MQVLAVHRKNPPNRGVSMLKHAPTPLAYNKRSKSKNLTKLIPPRNGGASAWAFGARYKLTSIYAGMRRGRYQPLTLMEIGKRGNPPKKKRQCGI